MSFLPANEVAEAFQCFDLIADGISIYEFSPVFKVKFNGQAAILKSTRSPSIFEGLSRWLSSLQAGQIAVVVPLTNARQADGKNWVLYPFIAGRAYQGTLEDIASAGKLLGQMHSQLSQHLPHFGWPDNTADSISEDKVAISNLLQRNSIDADTAKRLLEWEDEFNTLVYEPLRAAQLIWTDVPMDFKANNLIYVSGTPVLVDPDNADYAPRIFDLALAALLFHLDLPGSHSMFNAQQWQTFYGAYGQQVQLTATEQQYWPLALRYIFQEWAVWHLVSEDNWKDNNQAQFMRELASVDLSIYTL